MNEKKTFTFKYEKSDAVISTPKTPVKKVPYKDIFSTPPSVEDLPQYSRLISTGDFFEVYLNRANGKDCLSDTECTAVKKSIGVIRNDLEKMSMLREVEFLKMIESEYVIKFINSWILNQYIFIEVEYCNYGTLRDYMNYIYFQKKSEFSYGVKRKIIKEIALGLEAIHRLKIVHLDIKPENIFLKSRGERSVCLKECECKLPEDEGLFTLKIGDFNISRYENEEIGMDGDKRYMAPEVLDGVCTRKGDIFSLGLIYLEILNGIILPTSGEGWLNIRNDNFKGIKLEGPIEKMLRKNYKKRIDCKEVLDYFK